MHFCETTLRERCPGFRRIRVKRLEVPGTLKRFDDEAFAFSAMKEIAVRGSEGQPAHVSKLLEKAMQKIPDCKLVRQ